MRRKGFTLVELLVVIAIIALLMGILMPALARVRRLAQRIVCGTNLSGIGKAMMMYANENDEDYPRAGGRGSQWDTDGRIASWTEPIEEDAFGMGLGDPATIGSSFYLLVKYADVAPKQFICKGDGAKVFNLSGFSNLRIDFELIDAWDFGGDDDGEPKDYYSYSYHIPYADSATIPGFPVTALSNSGSPVCADRNPWLDRNAEDQLADSDLDDASWDTSNKSYIDRGKKENAAAHQFEGQSVLFNDSHVGFEKYPNIGIENDNIYKHWIDDDPTAEEMQVGNIPSYIEGDWGPRGHKDAWLVSEDTRQP